ncbi:MAG: sporulation integral membrane protein YtvI, partial [Clostridia bacterium]|nr:sporulation integral membrane protein YtvI [Clostridia bacterium]
MAGKDEKQRSIFFTLALAIMAFLIFRYAVVNAIAPLIPLLVALAVSALLRPAAEVFSKRTKIPYKVCGGIVSVLTVLFAGFVSAAVAVKLCEQLGGFVGGLLSGLEKEDNVLRRLIDFFINLRERIPIFEKLGAAIGPDASDRIYAAATDVLRSLAQGVYSWTASAAGGIVSSFPGAVFAAAVSVAGIYYLTTDRDGVRDSFLDLLPRRARDALTSARRRLKGGVAGYLRAYLIIMLVTFCELLVGFLILGFRYSFLIAAAIAVIDILPVLGSGTVLWPWAAILFISGDVKRGIGLLVLIGVMYVVRQIIEPKLLGKYMGHHPFVALFSAYLGFSLFGIPGMIAAPVAVFILKAAFNTEKKPS